MNIWQVINVEVLQYEQVPGTLILEKNRKGEENGREQLISAHKHVFHNECKNEVPKWTGRDVTCEFTSFSETAKVKTSGVLVLDLEKRN